MTKNKAPEDLLAAIQKAERLLLTSHLNPDGDAIGSGLGLARVLRAVGKSALFWTHDEVPGIYSPLAGSGRVHVGAEPPPGFPDAYDTCVVLECPTLERSGLDGHLADFDLINIDHHMGNTNYGRVNWVDTAAPALGEMIHTLAGGLSAQLDRAAASCLYLALVSDTGGFRFNNTTARAFEAAADLVRAGAEPQQIASWLYESRPLGSVRLLGETLGTLALHADGAIATVTVSQEMFERAGARPGDSEGLIDHARSIAGVEAAALLREQPDGLWKVSLRSRDRIDVEAIARRHGGGGHRNAAGFKTDLAVGAAIEAVVSELITAAESAAESK